MPRTILSGATKESPSNRYDVACDRGLPQNRASK
jgi:hypothetical protein